VTHADTTRQQFHFHWHQRTDGLQVANHRKIEHLLHWLLAQYPSYDFEVCLHGNRHALDLDTKFSDFQPDTIFSWFYCKQAQPSSSPNVAPSTYNDVQMRQLAAWFFLGLQVKLLLRCRPDNIITGHKIILDPGQHTSLIFIPVDTRFSDLHLLVNSLHELLNFEVLDDCIPATIDVSTSEETVFASGAHILLRLRDTSHIPFLI
jgi:hypothetical protein